VNVSLSASSALKYGGMGLVGFAVFLLVVVAGVPDSSLSRLFKRYTKYLDGSLRLLDLSTSGRTILWVQIALVVAVCAVEAGMRDAPPFGYVMLPLVAVGPIAFLAEGRRRRSKAIEEQVDGFLLTFSNALRSVPSPSAALQSVVPFVPFPFRQELERVVKEMRVGSTLDQALVNMSARVGSAQLDTALSSVLVGLQVGGNLPLVLESTASAIREMRRLENVVRAKTGEARAQLWVLGLFPVALVAGFGEVSPGFFLPLENTAQGIFVGFIAAAFWVASMIVARQVLAVDI
jgi:tight adherence protein B